MCGIYHSKRRPRSGCITAHMCGKNHCQLVFLWSGKNQTCVAFIKHLPNTGCVEKDTHVCKKPNRCVFFQTGGATFCICTCIWVFDIWYSVLHLYLSFQRRPCNIRRQEHLQNSLEKNHLFGNSHTCVEKPTHIKNKNSKNNINTNKFCMWSPPQLKDFL